jgi:transposase
MIFNLCFAFRDTLRVVAMAPKQTGASLRTVRRGALLVAWDAWKVDKTEPYASIGKKLGIDPRTVASWFKRFEAGDTRCVDKERSGRPRKLSHADVRKAKRHLTGTPSNSIASATRLVNKDKAEGKTVCSRTMRRTVKREHKGTLTYDAVKRAPVSTRNVKLRVEATTAHKRASTRRQLKNIVFLDAAIVRWKKGGRIQAFRVQKAWGARDCPRKQDLAAKKLFHFYSAITLGPNSEVYRHPLIFVPAGKGLDAQCFVNKVAKPVHRWATTQVFEHNECVYAQDNATCHTAASTKAWMVRNCYKLHDHPPQSPDLNRIEKAWAFFKRALERKAPRSEERLKEVMEEVWQGLDADILKRFICELPAVMKKVHENPSKHVNA